MRGLRIYSTNTAGLFTISWLGKERWQTYAVHFFPYKDQRQWGMLKEWYDGPIYSFGLGPFLLICWTQNE